MLAGVMAAIGLSAVLKYKVVVKAPATVRPIGELRLVQAAKEGTVLRIEVQENQVVKAGQPIAQIDNSRWLTKHSQLQGNLQLAQRQLEELDTQRLSLEQQIAAEHDQMNRGVAAAESDVRLKQRHYQEKQVSTVSEVQEAEAAVNLARETLRRYQELSGTGAIAQLQVNEKQAVLQAAEARLARVNATLNPTTAEIEIAQEKVAQSQSSISATLARLNQDRQQLLQKRVEIQKQRDSDQKELQQVETDLKTTVIRAPIAGIIQSLNLRDRLQVVRVGDELAQIAPAQPALQIKALVAVQDIGKVVVGQSAQMRVSACAYPDYGTLKGTVQSMSPDAMSSPRNDFSPPPMTGEGKRDSYSVTIQPASLTLSSRQQDCVIQSGMEGEVEIISREETILHFLLRRARLIVG